nr:Aromatic amino acid beta-eliminating lyase threonine aldolase domain containing protein [Haemonchus contortus]
MQRLWRITSLLRIRVDCGRDLRFYQKRRMVMKPTPQYTTTVPNSAQCIDMRSDTVTLPSDEMKEAMMKAVLGDDVYGEDRTVNELEERCAQLFGKEAGLFVASGTMGNLLAIMAHCQRGDEIIVGRYNHIHRWEQGNYAQLAGVSATTVDVGSDGTMKIDDIEDAIRVQDIHMPNTRLICLETTHNYSGGRPLPLDYIRSVRELASKHGLNVHIDGARIYNAAIALGVEVRDIAQYADSVMMCFSKGLGAPVGSILVGSKAFIDKARRSRKAVGGGWRQAGILAAAAHVALNNAEKTIGRDHANAQKLASGINAITPDNLKDAIHASDVGITNMVILKCNNGVSPIQVQKFFESRGVLMMLFDATRVRIVLNWGVTEEDVEKVLGHYKEFIQSLTNS